MTNTVRSIPNLVTRFLTIGFSKDHDAVFLNNIAQCGSELGNFFYIDTGAQDYAEQVKQCLTDSLNMAMDGALPIKLEFTNDLFQYSESFKVELNYEYDVEEEHKGDDLPIKEVILTVQTIVKSAVLDGDIQVRLQAQSSQGPKILPLQFVKLLVENPDEAIRVKAYLQSANKQIFDLIQNVQKETPQQRKNSFESLKVLDRDIDQQMQTAQKIKNRESKRELMDAILDCKIKVAKVIEILRASQNS